ncbi:MAG: hypothetical protein QOD33_580 [Pyrinomonadaceae bacterium]|nr:hypothetical protein [Pyrinomonadaceae bacterium]
MQTLHIQVQTLYLQVQALHVHRQILNVRLRDFTAPVFSREPAFVPVKPIGYYQIGQDYSYQG